MNMTSGSVADFNLNQATNYFRIPCGSAQYACIDMLLLNGTWATAVVEVKRSLDGVNFRSFPTTVTFPLGGGATAILDVSGYAYIGVEVTTAEGAAGVALITWVTKSP